MCPKWNNKHADNISVLLDTKEIYVISGVRRGGGGGGLPPEIGKIVVEIWCYLPEVYTFGAESEIQEIFSKNCEKGQFSI